jgi:hypothetical protein
MVFPLPFVRSILRCALSCALSRLAKTFPTYRAESSLINRELVHCSSLGGSFPYEFLDLALKRIFVHHANVRLPAASLSPPAWLSISKPSCRWHRSVTSSLGTHRFCDTFHSPTARFHHQRHSDITNPPMSHAWSLALLKDQDL